MIYFNPSVCVNKPYIFQNYNVPLGTTTYYKTNQCAIDRVINAQKSARITNAYNMQILYSLMCRYPNRFPIIPSVQGLNYTPQQKRQYSNIYWRRLGASGPPSINDYFTHATSITGSDIPYLN